MCGLDAGTNSLNATSFDYDMLAIEESREIILIVSFPSFARPSRQRWSGSAIALCPVSTVTAFLSYILAAHKSLDAISKGCIAVALTLGDSLLSLQFYLKPRYISGLGDVFYEVGTPGNSKFGKHLSWTKRPRPPDPPTDGIAGHGLASRRSSP